MSDSKSKSQLLEMDLYKLLDCEETCTIEQLKKAYRKRALELHPDKNPDKKEEAERAFIQLGKAFEILADKSARAAYDAARKAKREKALRDSQMDIKRREMKEKLENREKAARELAEQKADKYALKNYLFFSNPYSYSYFIRVRQDKAEEAFYNEIERVRKENRRLLEEENNKIFEQLRQEKLKRVGLNSTSENKSEAISASLRIKVTWPASESERLNKQFLEDLFGNYGHVENFLIGSKASKPSAILEFKSRQDGMKCMRDERVLYEKYSIQLKCLDHLDENIVADGGETISLLSASSSIDPVAQTESFEDLEARILKKMRTTKN